MQPSPLSDINMEPWMAAVIFAFFAVLALCWLLLPFILMSRLKQIQNEIARLGELIGDRLVPTALNMHGTEKQQLAVLQEALAEGPMARLASAKLVEQVSALTAATERTNQLLEWIGEKEAVGHGP